nr:MAG TPA: hypothetical protein [Caudoviricetes sp.]
MSLLPAFNILFHCLPKYCVHSVSIGCAGLPEGFQQIAPNLHCLICHILGIPLLIRSALSFRYCHLITSLTYYHNMICVVKYKMHEICVTTLCILHIDYMRYNVYD